MTMFMVTFVLVGGTAAGTWWYIADFGFIYRGAGTREIGAVPAGTFELSACDGNLFVKCFLRTDSAGNQNRIAQFLQNVLLVIALLALIGVNRHVLHSSWFKNKHHIDSQTWSHECKSMNFTPIRMWSSIGHYTVKVIFWQCAHAVVVRQRLEVFRQWWCCIRYSNDLGVRR